MTSITYSFNPASPPAIGTTTANSATFTDVTLGDANSLIFGSRGRIIFAASAATIRNAANNGTGDINVRTVNAGTSVVTPFVVSDIVTQVTPTTGQTINAGITKANETLYITPAGTLAALTIALPTAANSRVGQIERVFSTQIVASLTLSVSGGGSVVGGAPDTSIANFSFNLICVSVSGSGTWIVA